MRRITFPMLLAAVLATGVAAEKGQAGGAGTGAAIGGFIGLVLGFDVFDVAAGAVIGAVAGGVAAEFASPRAPDPYNELQHDTDDLSDKQAEQSRLMDERKQLEAEYREVLAERARLEAKAAQPVSEPVAEPATKPQIDPDEALGQDNIAGFQALLRCEHAEAVTLSRTGRLSDNQNHRLASLWLEALIASDAGSEPSFERVIKADPDVADETEASEALRRVEAMIAEERQETGITCAAAAG